MKFISLASSSKGNAYIIDDSKTKLLLECGVTFKRLRELTEHKVSDISACLISHEHKDHSRCVKDIILSGIPVYSSYGTAEALGLDTVNVIEEKEMVTIGTFDIMPFMVFHDAAEPMGFLIRSRETNKRLLFATDTAGINYEFARLNIIALECNYLKEILQKSEHLPEKVRYRIQNSHMEANEAARYITTLDLSCLEKVYLLHLSDACSNERIIEEIFIKILPDREVIICDK